MVDGSMKPRVSSFMANLQMKEQNLQASVAKVTAWLQETKEKERIWRRKVKRAAKKAILR